MALAPRTENWPQTNHMLENEQRVHSVDIAVAVSVRARQIDLARRLSLWPSQARHGVGMP